MSAFDRAFRVVIGHEGGYVNDPRDPGGETKFGISRRCIHPSCRVLTAGLQWVRADSLRVGDALLAFDESPEKHGKLNLRRFRVATVDDVGPVSLPASRITTERAELIASDDHQWLRRWGAHRVFGWATTSDLLKPTGKWTNGVEVRIGTLFPPWERIETREAGYLAGVLDGEGSVGSTLDFAQKTDNALVEQALQCAAALGLEFRPCGTRNGVTSYRLTNGAGPFHHIVTAGRLGANRLLRRAAARLIGKSIASTKATHDRVLAVEPVGVTDLVGISTSTKTLIVEGYLSHNSYPHLDIRNLTVEDAKRIYRRDYWDRVRGDDLPYPVAMCLFDYAVNSGVETAVRAAQKVLGLKTDGILGPITFSAIYAQEPRAFVSALQAERLLHLSQLTSFPTFGRGWTRRIVSTAIEAFT